MKKFIYLWHGIVLLAWIIILFFLAQDKSFSLASRSIEYPDLDFFSQSSQKETTTPKKDSDSKKEANIKEKTMSLSLQNIMDNVSAYGDTKRGTGMVSTEQLLEIYKKAPSPDNTIQLIEQLRHDFSYHQAYEILQENTELWSDMDTKTVLHILLNSKLVANKTRDLAPIELFIQQSTQAKRLSEAESQWYLGLLEILKGNKEDLNTMIRETKGLSGSEEKAQDLLNKRINYARQGNDVSAYHEDGMIALSLFEQGYITIGQELSLQLLNKHPEYILPKQILAYTHIILHEWREAKSYFIEIMSLDPENSNHYQFFIGVSSYRMNNFTDAILYLSQINEKAIHSDAIRYKLLSYLALKDHNNTAKQFKSVLGRTDIRESDMLLFWEKAIFEPYATNREYSILEQDKSLVELYSGRCTDGGFDNDVCQLGSIAQSLYQHKAISNTTITPLLNKFPKSYLFLIAANSYSIQGETEAAKTALVKALSLTDNDELKTIIRKKLQSIL